jgi:hypothetical protein
MFLPAGRILEGIVAKRKDSGYVVVGENLQRPWRSRSGGVSAGEELSVTL